MTASANQNSIDVLASVLVDARETVERVTGLISKLPTLTAEQRSQLYGEAEELNNATMLLVDDLA